MEEATEREEEADTVHHDFNSNKYFSYLKYTDFTWFYSYPNYRYSLLILL